MQRCVRGELLQALSRLAKRSAGRPQQLSGLAGQAAGLLQVLDGCRDLLRDCGITAELDDALAMLLAEAQLVGGLNTAATERPLA